MINRKIVWLSTLILTTVSAGCGGAPGDVKITGNETHQAYGHNVNKISGFALENDMDELKIDDEDRALPETLEFNPVSIAGGEPLDASQKVESFVSELISVKAAVGDIWNEDFNSLYSSYLNHSYIVQDENMTLTEAETEDVAFRIEELHNQYAALEQDLKDLEVPKSMAEDNMDAVERVIDEITRAVDNRTLALIEFKSIYENDDYVKHEEMMEIHVENSNDYIDQADESINDLIALVNEQ